MRGLVGMTELAGNDILVHDNGGRLVGHLCGSETAHSLDNALVLMASLEAAGTALWLKDGRLDVTFGQYYVPGCCRGPD
jgi:hypothetical protein